MRALATGFALAFLVGATALAAPSPQLTLVEVYETGQALIYDRAAGEYVLIRPGSEIQGYRVESVTADQLELTSDAEPERRYIVTRPIRPGEARAGQDTEAAVTAPPPNVNVTAAPSSPADPDSPIDPYGSAAGERVKVTRAPTASAPQSEPPRERVKVTRAPAASAPRTEASEPRPDSSAPRSETDERRGDATASSREAGERSQDSRASAPRTEGGDRKGVEVTSGPAVSARPAPRERAEPSRAPAPPQPSPVSIRRAELDEALEDFDAVSREVELEAISSGIRVVSIGAGTLPYRLGLRRGDVIRSVAGVETRSLEDGADVYVKLSRIKRFDVEITRDDHELTLPVRIQ